MPDGYTGNLSFLSYNRAMFKSTHTILEIALPVPLHRTFDYLYLALPNQTVGVGCRARVTLGNKEYVGIVVKQKEQSQVALKKLKQIVELIDQVPLLNEQDIELAQWVIRYYHAPPGEIINLLFHGQMRRGGSANTEIERRWLLATRPKGEAESQLANAPKQRVLWKAAKERNAPFTRNELLQAVGAGFSAPWHALCAKGLILPVEECNEDPMDGSVTFPPLVVASPRYALSDEQHAARDLILPRLDAFNCLLLDGVTGSGKTEVYLQAMTIILEKQQQVLVLVPEIGLISQLAHRIRRRFGIEVAVYHSELGEKARLAVWHGLANNQLRVVVGTRSALFLSLPKLGLIVVDEEHDLSYKQQEAVRYSARDVAVRRAQLNQIPILLGSATPSLESLANVERGRYTMVKLSQRVSNQTLPDVRLVDTRGTIAKDGLSAELINAMHEHLDAGSQVLLFLNRRGYSPVIYCADCGWTACCPYCSARMTYHTNKNLLSCHHCNTSRPLQNICPKCKGSRLLPVGKGTERVEAAIRSRFPNKNAVRIDRDSVPSSTHLDKIMQAARDKKVDILLGTQMLAKGHHLPGITLAAIIDMDSALYSVDFRSLERAGQMITQVFGRSGRGESQGQVIIQTSLPEHPVLELLLRRGYSVFAQHLLTERRDAHLPPYSFQASIRAQGYAKYEVNDFLRRVAELIRSMNIPNVFLFGPMSGALEKCAGHYRMVLIVQSETRSPLQNCLQRLVLILDKEHTTSRVRWHIDVDPQDAE